MGKRLSFSVRCLLFISIVYSVSLKGVRYIQRLLTMEVLQREKNDPDHNKNICESTEVLQSTESRRLGGNRSPSMGSLSIRDIADTPEPYGLLSVSAVLHYCKCKILRPYLRLLGVMGLRPLAIDTTEISSCVEIIGLFYMVQVVLFVIGGYVLQYMACFRRDRGFCYHRKALLCHTAEEEWNIEQICHGSFVFSFLLPSFLHLIAYIYAVYLFRISNNENLSNLMERVFLSSSNPSDGSVSQKKLVRILWFFIAMSIIWIILSFVLVNFMLAETVIIFKWMDSSSPYAILTMKILLIICTLWHDMIQAALVTSYCLQAQLLTSYLYFLRAKLILQPVRPIEWMKELLEFKNLLKYLNKDLAPAVCIFTIINVSWGASGIIWLLDYDNIDKSTLPIVGISILNVCLWLMIALAPFIQAARLTNACVMIQSVGHEVRTRPFAHQDTPTAELDSVLLYTSSLRLNANLFCVPITGKYLCLGITISTMVLLTLGQCHYLQHSL